MRGGDLEALRQAFAAGSTLPPAPADCPEPGTIWLAVRGELPAGALREVVDHLAACPPCTEEWRLAVAFERPQEDAAAASAPAARHGRFRPLALRLAAAGSAAALFVAGLLLRTPVPVPVLRGGAPPAASSMAPRLVETGGRALSRQSCLLHWSGPPGAVYDLVVRTRSGRTVARASGLAVPFYRVPAAELAGLPPGTVLEWQVSAALPGGRGAASKIETFTLR
jgi:hypothetical protein